MRLGFAGTPPFAVPALAALACSRHRLEVVFTQPDRPAGRGQAMRMSAVKQRALELQLTVQEPPDFKAAVAETVLRGLGLDALVVVAYGLILPPAVLAVPALGCFNIHASLLPRWRGAAPIHRALLAGDAVTGITIMRMEAGLDTGPMLKAAAIPISLADTAGSLHDRLATLGAELVVAALDDIAAGRSCEQVQPMFGVTYAAKLDKSEARIDWRDDARLILRRVRAFNPWPIAETKLNGLQVRIWEAEPSPVSLSREAPRDSALPGQVLAATNEGIDVACGAGVLRVLRLQLAGRKPLAARDFINARGLDGMRFACP